MHHIHGIVNILNCALWAGADCHMHDKKFNANEVLDRLLNENFNLFMAVPTIYGNLANYIR
jgi:malonyl-CoA/methylmalonyl-CoA synthetase